METHPAFEKLKTLAQEKGVHHFAYMTQLLETMAKETGAPFLSYLIRNVNLYPDLHGTLPFQAYVSA